MLMFLKRMIKKKQRKMTRSNSITAITAGGTVLYRQQNEEVEVLLIKRNGVWDIAKGKKEKKETIEECAKRETEEELGLTEVHIEGFLINTYHTYTEKKKNVGKTTHWFAATTEETKMKPQKEEGITKLDWFPLADAKEKVEYENLKLVLEAFSTYLVKKKYQ